MTLLSLLVVIIVCGLIVYVVNLLPIAEPFKKIAVAIVVVVMVLYLLSAVFGFLPNPEVRLR